MWMDVLCVSRPRPRLVQESRWWVASRSHPKVFHVSDVAYVARVTTPSAVVLQPILANDVDPVARFLHQNLNPRLSSNDWAGAIRTGWPEDEGPNHGVMLLCDGAIVGANLAFYSSRDLDGVTERFCNLAALCVREEFRAHAVRLVRALLKQRGYSFTDFSPSGNVVAMDERLGFRHLDTSTVARPNLPIRRQRNIEILTDHDQIESVLDGRDLRVFLDHQRCSAAKHVVLRLGAKNCYIVFRIDRRKRLRLFASLLYVSEPDLYARWGAHLGWFFLKHRTLVTLVESRLVGSRQLTGVRRDVHGRPKMFKSSHLDPSQIDYLYSELTCVAW